MASFTTRAGKGSALTNNELDANFTAINAEMGTNRVTVASHATTADIWAAVGNSIDWTGTATTTDFPDAPAAGFKRWLHCAGACTFTNNANLDVQGGANYTAAAGDMVLVVAITTSTFQLTIFKADGTPVVAPAASAVPYLHMRDQKTNGTDGGTFTLGAWQTRTLNTTRTNNISGASLSSNQITLAAGTYQIRARAPSVDGTRHKAKLYNITDSADVILGSNAQSTGGSVQTDSFVVGEFTIAGSKVFELQHQIETTANTYGFGRACNFGTEVYAEVEIWKVS